MLDVNTYIHRTVCKSNDSIESEGNYIIAVCAFLILTLFRDFWKKERRVIKILDRLKD